MFKPSLLLVSFSFLFLATLDAIPMEHRVDGFFHLSSTPENHTTRTARNRRRSSLLPSGFMARGTKSPAEKKLLPQESSSQNSQEDSILSDETHLDDSFENQIKSYDDAITEASKKFYILVEKIRLSSTPADDAFESLSDAKGTVLANTYYYTTALLEKIVSLETENPDKASSHWEELVEKTKSLVELLEKHQSICETYFSSNYDAINETLSEIHFYNARLAEYEAEKSTTDALVARNNYLSVPESPQFSINQESPRDRLHEGSALAVQSAQVPMNFHYAAEAYRWISKDIAADDITRFHEMMALWCEARASEMAITAVANTAHVHGINWPHDDLTKKAQQSYAAVITACTDLAPKFSDEEFESEQHEIARYLQEATNRKLLLEVQLQEDRVNSLLSQELNPASSEHEKLLHHENLLNQLEIFQTTSLTGLEQAPERLKSLWQQFHQEEISSAMETTTGKLKENISLLVQQAAEQEQATFLLFDGTSSVPVSWAKAIGAAKITHAVSKVKCNTLL